MFLTYIFSLELESRLTFLWRKSYLRMHNFLYLHHWNLTLHIKVCLGEIFLWLTSYKNPNARVKWYNIFHKQSSMRHNYSNVTHLRFFHDKYTTFRGNDTIRKFSFAKNENTKVLRSCIQEGNGFEIPCVLTQIEVTL